ncbi:MAG: TerB family tellurite resistance protein [Bacteroidetes bacterium]|nr:TerB family tellurite resistance protein [Bacteroidota bacterium]MBL6962989.1 TerB family tellurite resistance protein [Bacteroidota bacterium]
MIKRERLYDAFGDLIYAIALADGQIQNVEVEVLSKILEGYKGATDIRWSFDYNRIKGKSVEETYQRAIEVCKENGPDPEYPFLIELMVKVAKAYKGIVPSEQIILEKFATDLKAKFTSDLEKLKLL